MDRHHIPGSFGTSWHLPPADLTSPPTSPTMSAMRSDVLLALCLLQAVAGLFGRGGVIEGRKAKAQGAGLLPFVRGWHPDEQLYDALDTVDKVDTAKWGYMKGGRVVIAPRFDAARWFSEGLAPVRVGHLWGYIDVTGRYLFAPQFDEACPFFEGRAPVRAGDRWGFVNRNGSYIISPQFDSADAFTRGLAPVRVGSHWGFIDTTGAYVITPRFDRVFDFFAGVAPVKVADTWVYIDKTGKEVFRPEPDDALMPSNRMPEPTKLGGRWGYKDTAGTVVIGPQFDEAYSFFYGFALVKAGGKWGYIDKTGRYVWKEKRGPARGN